MRPLIDPRARRVSLFSAAGFTGLLAGLAVVPAIWLACWLAVLVAQGLGR